MDLERQREIASKGGRSVPAEKRSFSQDRELASSAGRKGGQSTTPGVTAKIRARIDIEMRRVPFAGARLFVAGALRPSVPFRESDRR